LLSDVVANFLQTLSEVEFFDAFAAILRANDFYDIHLVHGVTEHGKDFIAKRIEGGRTVQYAIQTKVGNTNTGAWREARLQIETIRTSSLSHPAFDASLPRRAVLAMTGRLVGQAPTEAQDYKRNWEDDQFGFEVWQLDELLGMMTDAPEAGLAGEPDAPLLGAVAAIYEKSFTEASLELLSRSWSNPVGETASLWRAALSAFVLAHRLALNDRRDLAALVGVHLIRAAWARCNDADDIPEEVLGVAEAGKGLLLFHATAAFEVLKELPEDAEQFIMATATFGDYVVYPVRCMRLLELLGLLALGTDDEEVRQEVVEFCANFIQAQPGASHPISDHWAVAIPPVAILMYAFDRDLLGRWLQAICVWVVDHYEDGQAGLAEPWASANDEVQQLLLPGVIDPGDRRPDSLLAAAIIDLPAALEMGTIYDSLVNEVMAVRMFPSVIEADEGIGFYQDSIEGVFVEPWVQYDGKFDDAEGWPCCGPHRRCAPPYLLRIGRPWDLMAISSALRDRWYPLAWRSLAGV
jgi:hypothetical protein